MEKITGLIILNDDKPYTDWTGNFNVYPEHLREYVEIVKPEGMKVIKVEVIEDE